MPSTRKPPAELTEYLTQAFRHIAEVASKVGKTLDRVEKERTEAAGARPVGHTFGRWCDLEPELVPRPFGRWCDGRADATEAGRGAVRRSNRARKQVRR